MASKEQWQQAQKGEINHHVGNFDLNEPNRVHYYNVYKTIFDFVSPGFTFDAANKKIMEIGPGVFAALLSCQNTQNSFIVEPMDLPENVVNVYKEKNITILKGAVEDLNLPQVDEVWIFNVMQHILNPDLFVSKLKKIAKKILFFEPIGTPVDGLHIYSYTLQDFQKYFGETSTKEFVGGSVPSFHTAMCAYGIWDKATDDTSKNLSVIGIGKLGLCFALALEKSGFDVCGVDISQEYVDSINNKQYNTSEPLVEDYLKTSKNFIATTDFKQAIDSSDTFFTIVATPSLPDGKYSHSQVENVIAKIKSLGVQEQTKHLVICCTVMPGYCLLKQKELEPYNWIVSYNPEFIAQGTVIKNQENPDMILIGEANEKAGDSLVAIYNKLCKNSPKIHRMMPTSAEVTKIGLNCFLVTKIAYANMVGDISETIGAETDKILSAIGDDSRVGPKFLKYGFGFGGPCLPRDARALGILAKENGCNHNIAIAADEANKIHLTKQVELATKTLSKENKIYFQSVTYKPESVLIEESQQLKYAAELANKGYSVTINEREEVVDLIKKEYGTLFEYQIRSQPKNKKVISFTLFGGEEIYLRGAVENAKLAQIHYPGWECRFYVDVNVPSKLLRELTDHGAVVVVKANLNGYSGLFWRFEPITEENVDVWISRDVDSRLSEKEALAVHEWLASDKTFHIMRDAHNHDLYAIMAGMFGVRNDLLKKRYGTVDLTCPGHVVGLRDSDQIILQERLWGLAYKDHMCHDHWAHNKPISTNLTTLVRDPLNTYVGQGVAGHVSNRRQNYPHQFAEGSINNPFPAHSEMEYGLYLGQRITENNTPIWNEEVQWEYELRGKKW